MEDAGTSTNPVIVDSYGTGRATISSGPGRGVGPQRGGHHRAQPAGRGWAATAAARSACCSSTTVPAMRCSYVRVTNLDVSGYREYGIAIGGWNGRSGFSDVRVERVVSHDNGDSGMVTYAAARNVHRNVRGASRFQQPGSARLADELRQRLVLGGVDGAIIERNLAFSNGGLNTTIQGGVGIWAYDSTRVTMQRNESYATHRRTRRRGGFNFDQNTRTRSCSSTTRTTTTATGSCWRTTWTRLRTPATSSGTTSARTTGGRTAQEGSASSGGSPMRRSTRTRSPSSARRPARRPSARRQAAHRPGPLPQQHPPTRGGAPLLAVSAGAVANEVDLLFQGNDWYASGATPRFVWGSVTYTTLTAWRTATGAERVGTRAVGTSADPLFVGGDAPTIGDASRLGELRNHYGPVGRVDHHRQGRRPDRLRHHAQPGRLHRQPQSKRRSPRPRRLRAIGAAQLGTITGPCGWVPPRQRDRCAPRAGARCCEPGTRGSSASGKSPWRAAISSGVAPASMSRSGAMPLVY